MGKKCLSFHTFFPPSLDNSLVQRESSLSRILVTLTGGLYL